MSPSRPSRLLTQNSELRKVGVFNWTLPAWLITLPNGEHFNVCPSAGVCARVCYARFGTYNFSNVKKRHLENLMYVLEDADAWEKQMLHEVWHKRFQPSRKTTTLDHDPTDIYIAWWLRAGGKAVRIHDAGDFFSDDYLLRWKRIAEMTRHVLFYAYTKEVTRVKALGPYPSNLRFIFSIGGREDHLIDKALDRHADVFPSEQALIDAGYYDQEENDLLAITAPSNRIGIVANNIAVARKRFDGRSMSEMKPGKSFTERLPSPNQPKEEE